MIAPAPELAIYELLRVHTGVTGLVGKKIYPLQPYTNDEPYILFKLAGTKPRTALGGKTSICDAEVELMCIALKYDLMKRIANATFAALNGRNKTETRPSLFNVRLLAEEDYLEITTAKTVTGVRQNFSMWYYRT